METTDDGDRDKHLAWRLFTEGCIASSGFGDDSRIERATHIIRDHRAPDRARIAELEAENARLRPPFGTDLAIAAARAERAEAECAELRQENAGLRDEVASANQIIYDVRVEAGKLLYRANFHTASSAANQILAVIKDGLNTPRRNAVPIIDTPEPTEKL